MKIKLSTIFDFVFGTGFVFLICFIWARYFIHHIALTLIVCATITFCIVALYYFISSKKQKKQSQSKSELEIAHNISTHFLLSTKQETLKEFYKILSGKTETKMKSDLLTTKNIAIRPLYNSTEITDRDVLESYSKIKNTNIEKIIIFCISCSVKAREIASIISKKEIVILTELDAYKTLFKPLNFVVEKEKTAQKLTFKQKLLTYAHLAFNKQRTKNYLFVSVVLLFSSFILRYNVYYLITSTLTVGLALYSHFNTKFNSQTTTTSVLSI